MIQKGFSIISLFFLVITSLTITSCLDNFNRDIETIYYHPSYSIPIGTLSYRLPDIMPGEALTPYMPDIISTPDTPHLIIYDDMISFINPEIGYDTVILEPFSLQSVLEQSEYIVSVMLRANITNGLPVNTSVQLYMISDFGSIIDSIYKEGPEVIESEIIQLGDSAAYSHYTTIETYLDTLSIQNFLQTSVVGLYIRLETYHSENDTLRVYSNQHFDTQLAVRIGLNVPL